MGVVWRSIFRRKKDLVRIFWIMSCVKKRKAGLETLKRGSILGKHVLGIEISWFGWLKKLLVRES